MLGLEIAFQPVNYPVDKNMKRNRRKRYSDRSRNASVIMRELKPRKE